MTGPEEAELAYYRAVEDQFAALRGTPFLFSPKDFSLLRRWWREGAPLAAVLAGIGEAWERRREREADPISSLSYCRHAVARHVKRLSDARVGAAESGRETDAGEALRALARRVNEAAEAWQEDVPQVAAILRDLARAVATLPPDTRAAVLDEVLADLEFATLDAVLAALPSERREALAAAVEREIGPLEVSAEVEARTRRALVVKELRRVVGMPRLEIPSNAP